LREPAEIGAAGLVVEQDDGDADPSTIRPELECGDSDSPDFITHDDNTILSVSVATPFLTLLNICL
jgi:hypothetical protein